MQPPDATVRPFLTALRDRWWIVVLCTLASGLLAYATVRQQPGQYQASALLGLHNQYIDRDIFALSPSQKSAEQTLAEQPGQLDTNANVVALAKKLGLQPATDFRNLAAATSVSIDPKYYLPVVQGRDRDAKRAALLANTYAQVLVARRGRTDQRRMQKALNATQSRLDVVDAQYAKATGYLDRRALRQEVNRLVSEVVRLRTLEQFRPPTLSVARWAAIPTTRTRAPAKVIGAIAAVFGLMMGCALLGWREQRDRRPRAGEILTDLDSAILTDLPRSSLWPGARPHGPFAGEAAALDAVRAVVQADRPHTALAITEAVSLGRAGATARLLGETAVRDGSRTLLATNDPRVPEGVRPDGLIVARYPIGSHEAAREWLQAQRADHDLVIVDLPSPVGSSAALEFASLADRVVAVWVADSITRRQLSRLGRTLRRAGIPLSGVLRVGGQAA